ncbi:ATP-binding protein [Streptomyces sp. JL1001]|uniref:ATP-binding protein n=1 Tax=Streptomyces sp. JL1001 TaxID=3078227 RepID=A0AAU8KCF2_9ACTN|nr:ATP-binding protein [Streptomyces sp. CB02613]SCE00070.1 Anti-sigma regulatory factor (Ser/Thr protein kinase) [Streptomyces sp. Termitarium-T10T-6]
MPLTLPVMSPPKAVHRLALRDDAEAPSELREWIAKRLMEHESELIGHDLALVASELASNAVVHGIAPAHACLIKVESPDSVRVRLEISDSGPGFDWTRAPVGEVTDLACGGRGLMIVAALSRAWGWRRVHQGHVVWAEFVSG